MSPDGEGRPLGEPATTTTVPPIVAPGADIERARRRLRLHHLLVRRPRWSNELDELLVDDYDGDDLAEPYHGDYWRDIGMTLGVQERRRAGMALSRWAA